MVREIKKQFVIIVLTIFLAVAADQFIEFIIKERAITNEKALVVQQLDTIRARLEGTLNANFNLVNGMSTAITINPDMGLDTFNDISKELLKQDNQLINIAAAPDLIIRYVYPLEGNEAILGIDYRQIPDQREAILQAIGLKQILLAGPVNLIQGGRGLILRIPIFVSVDLEPRFWGILSSVIDIEKLFKRAELLHSDIEVSIKGSDSKGEAGAIIYGRSDLFELNPILQQVNLPNGSWVIAAIPKNGWDFDTPFQLPIRLSIILLSLYFLYQYRLSMKQTRLRKLSEAKFSASFDRSTLGMMLSKGDRSTVLEINEVMCRIFEVSKPTVLNANFLDLGILPKEQVEKIVNLLRTDGQIPGLDLNFINSAGENRQLWFNASTIEIEGEALLLAIAEDITELKLKDERNQRIADSLTKAQAMANMGNWEWDAGNQRLICSEQTFNIIGWDYQNFLPTQQDFLDIVHPDDIAIAQNLFRSPEGYIDFELRIQRTDGEIRNIRQKTSFLADETGNPCHIFGTIQDITEQKQQFKDWELAKQVLDNTSDGIIVTELDGTILDVNSAFTQITGYSRSEAINKKPSIGKSGRHDNQFYAKLWQQLIQTGHWSGEIWDRKKNGSLYPKWLAINTIKNEFGEPDHYIGIFSDISAIKQAEEKLEKLAYYDPLTGLPNRELFQDRLGLEMNKAKRYGTKLALIYLDLDRFKNINDSLGHSAGDLLLQEIAKRLNQMTRDSDTVSRLSGDEFALIVTNLDELDVLSGIAKNMITQIQKAVTIEKREVHVGASIGIAVFPDDGTDVATLVRFADMAMYHAKEAGRNCFQFYTSELQIRALERLTLEQELRLAFKNKEFILHYQPKYHLKTGNIIGMEALVRWQSPTRGLVSPLDFIPLTEETGLIVKLGRRILLNACMQTQVWREAGFPDLKVAVNLSAREFQQQDLVKQVSQILAKTGLPATNLELEITESMVMEETELAIDKMNQLKSLGLQLAIDDFGTGYSSLSYLKRFPIKTLKIDRSFVRDLTTNSDDAEIAKAIISMAKSLELEVVAEGIETAEQLEFLNSQNCEYGQGYLFSKPVPYDAFFELVKRQL